MVTLQNCQDQLKELRSAKAEYQEALKVLDKDFEDLIKFVDEILSEQNSTFLSLGGNDEANTVTFKKGKNPEYSGVITRKRLNLLLDDLSRVISNCRTFLNAEIKHNVEA